MARKDRLGPVERDALVAGTLAVVVLVCSATDGQGPSIGPGDMAIAAATCAPLAVRSLWPLPVLAAVVAGTFASIATYDPSMIIAIPAMVALYTVAMRTDRRTTIAVAVVAVPIVVVMISLFSSHGIFAWETARTSPVALLPLALGSAKRDHHAYIAAIEERAERAERTREEEALRRGRRGAPAHRARAARRRRPRDGRDQRPGRRRRPPHRPPARSARGALRRSSASPGRR